MEKKLLKLLRPLPIVLNANIFAFCLTSHFIDLIKKLEFEEKISITLVS